MRKYALYLLILGVLALSGCSGGDGGNGFVPSTTANTLATMATLGMAGGSAQLSDTAKVTFSSYALSTFADIVFEKQTSDPGPISGSRAISGTYQLTIPEGKVSSLLFFQTLIAGTLSSLHLFDLNSNFITVEIPLDATALGTANYNFVGVKIDNGVNVTQLAGIFNLSNGKVKFSIPPLLLGSNRQKIRATLYSLDNVPQTLQQTLPSDVALYRFNSAADVIKAQPASSSSKTPLILIHGIQLADVLAPGSMTSLSEAYKETWAVFINQFFADAALQNRYDLYSFRYNTFDPIADNSGKLQSEINRVFQGSQPLTIVAHSMGGLVANDYIMNGGSGNLSRLITLGTPFHGSQAVHYLEQLMPVPMDIFIPLYNNGSLSGGAKDLHWDGSDGNYVEPDRYLYINRNRINNLATDTLSKYHVIAGINPLTTVAVKSFADFFTNYESVNNNVTYYNDGIVANRSALFSTYSNGIWDLIPRAGITATTFSGLNHMQLHDDPAVLNHVKGVLLLN